MEETNELKPWQCLDSTALKMIAMVCMLIDHAEGTIIYDQDWMSCVGRLAFPIFAFQIAEGYKHTSDFKKYLKRIFIWGLISIIPYGLLNGGPFAMLGQNVLFSFCISLLVIRGVDECRKKHWLLGLVALVGGAFVGFIAGTALLVDYSGYGILMTLSFWVFGQIKFGWLLQLASMIYINCFMINGLSFTLMYNGEEIWIPFQVFAVFAMIPILMYNGKKGKGGKTFQKAMYIFYPAHMLILGILAIILSEIG